MDGEWEAPLAWHLDSGASAAGRIEIRVGDQPIAVVPASAENHRVRVASSPDGVLGIVAVDLVNDGGSAPRSLFVPRRVSWNTDLAVGETYEVCAAFGRFDDQPALFADCTGGQTVTCPSTDGDPITCTIDARGYSLVTAPALAVAWERADFGGTMTLPPPIPTPTDNPDGGSFDAGRDGGRDAGLGIIRKIDMITLIGAGRLNLIGSRTGPGGACATPSVACDPPGACRAGRRFCVAGRFGACVPVSLDVCNGVDDDCDERIDERGAVSCNDGIACTVDECVHGACVHSPFPLRCAAARLGGATTSPACVNDMCNGVGVVSAGDAVTPRDPNGCQQILSNTFCTHVWDQCQCNGIELCAPGPGSDADTGCVPGPRFTPGGGFNAACDANGDPCDIDALCCEPNPASCRVFNALPAAAQSAVGLACNSLPSFSAPGAFNPPCVTPPGFIPIPTCADDNVCTLDMCNPATGACSHTNFPLGTAGNPDEFGGPPLCTGDPVAPADSCYNLGCNGASPTSTCAILPSSGACHDDLHPCVVNACTGSFTVDYGIGEPQGCQRVSGCIIRLPNQPDEVGFCVVEGEAPPGAIGNPSCFQCAGAADPSHYTYNGDFTTCRVDPVGFEACHGTSICMHSECVSGPPLNLLDAGGVDAGVTCGPN